jgi:hypothetical protein
MPWDKGLALLLRDDLAGAGAVEKKMFGGLAFMVGGHMACAIHKGGAMFRVGKPNEAAALAIPGTAPMTMAGRPMPGMIDCDDAACADDARRGALMALALGFVRGLPPK